MPANGRWDLIRRLKVNIDFLREKNILNTVTHIFCVSNHRKEFELQKYVCCKLKYLVLQNLAC